eukprot:gene2303-2652_t
MGKETRSNGTIPKEQFPMLLSRLINKLKSENIIAGFKATGNWPLDQEQVLKRMPSENKDPSGSGPPEALNESIMTVLKEHCGFGTPLSTKRKRGRKVEPGRAITDVLECTRENAKKKTKWMEGCNRKERQLERHLVVVLIKKTKRMRIGIVHTAERNGTMKEMTDGSSAIFVMENIISNVLTLNEAQESFNELKQSTTNGKADALSRCPITSDLQEQECCESKFLVAALEAIDISRSQDEDSNVQELKDFLYAECFQAKRGVATE